MQRVCRIFGLARSTAYYLKAREAVPPEERPVPRKRGPVGAATDADLVGHIRRVLAESPFHGEGYRKLWARLRFAGVRASPRRVRRVMRENGLLAPHRVGRTEAKSHDGTIITDKVNEMWGTDMTQTVTSTKAGPMSLLLWSMPIRRSSAFMPRAQPAASRRWSQYARGSIGASEPSHPA